MSQQVKRLRLSAEIDGAAKWVEAVATVLQGSLASQRWIPRESVDELARTRPMLDLRERVRRTRIGPLLDVVEREALTMMDVDLADEARQVNEKILAAELRDRGGFFNSIEKSPLTAEQSEAVITFDNRVQVIAAAGSGKTSVMIARAAYAIHRGFTTPDRILLLAFNKSAAAELQLRIEARLGSAGIDATGVRASTFHKFGLELIGAATGAKPRLAPWVDSGQDIGMVQTIVNDLRDSSASFRYKWDLYRLVFATARSTGHGGYPDTYDPEKPTRALPTFRGDRVKSEGERMIANWLFTNGINYRYEHPYVVDVADQKHSQYRPDFFYPDVDVWHEHWGVDRAGRARADFVGYAAGMTWKRNLHALHGTPLVETTWVDIIDGAGFDDLQRNLESHGLTFDWNPDRPLSSSSDRPPSHNDLVALVRTFMSHVKSNSLTADDLAERLSGQRRSLAGYRTNLFLELYWPIHAEWERRLREENFVDFEDMLILAADHLESGAVETPYELVMVDEFQDSSHARARLVRGLVRRSGRFLLTVGDDWQSVNRFAGADLAVMSDFETWFGAGPSLQLTTTFRCPQSICDVASAFVSKNPRQIEKAVTSSQPGLGMPVQLIRAVDPKKALAQLLLELSAEVDFGVVVPRRGGVVTVDILGRYRFDRELLPSRPPSNLKVSFRTAHGSKGLEADFIVVPRLESGTYGFPSGIADDPVLDLVMAAPDGYPCAEDRRLFYVALTRAIRRVTLISTIGRESAFVTELMRDKLVTIIGGDEVCEACDQGTMVNRTGRYGAFLGCSRYPACTHTRDVDVDAVPF